MSRSAGELFVLTGPTAVGKTELSLQWAEQHQAEIVSCDSLLFYRGMDIGTAKPSPAELARVPHHLVDVCEVREQMDISRYVQAARDAIEAIWQRGRRVLITGGSGFYLKAFFGPVTDTIDIPRALREEIERRLEREGLPSLVEELRALNGGELGALDTANPRRVVRALERCRASGRTLRELREAFSAQRGPFADAEVHCARLDRSPEELRERIVRRVKQMLQAGLVAEVQRLAGQGLRENPSAARAIGYRETLEMLEGRLSAADLPGAIAQNTWALVRKQRTWFRTQLPPHPVVAAETARAENLFN